jgi:hypothetical protein
MDLLNSCFRFDATATTVPSRAILIVIWAMI